MSVLEENPTHKLLTPSTLGQAGIDKEKIQRDMLKGHIVIGQEKNRSLKDAQSSYKPATLHDQTSPQASIEDNKKHLNVSLHLGSHLPNFISETKQMFTGQAVHPKDPQVKQMIEKNRINNFEFRDPGINTDPALHFSMAHTDFNYKGNAMEIR